MNLNSDAESYISQFMRKDDSVSPSIWRCVSCDYNSRNNHNVKHHIESKHITVSYQCQFCSKSCPTKVALVMHVKRYHK